MSTVQEQLSRRGIDERIVRAEISDQSLFGKSKNHCTYRCSIYIHYCTMSSYRYNYIPANNRSNSTSTNSLSASHCIITNPRRVRIKMVRARNRGRIHRHRDGASPPHRAAGTRHGKASVVAHAVHSLRIHRGIYICMHPVRRTVVETLRLIRGTRRVRTPHSALPMH